MSPIALIFGLIYFFFSFISLIFHFVVGFTLTRSPKFRKHIALRMMIFLSVSDSLQLIIHMFTGIVVIFELQIDHTVNLVIGFIAMTLWNATIFQQTILAVNRLYVLSRPKILLIGLSWICALLLHFGYFSQGDQFWFAFQLVNWLEVEPHTPLFLVFRYFKISLLIIGLLAGLGMLIIVIYQNYNSNSRNTKAKNKIQSAMEIRLFIQTCFSPALGLFNVVIWTCCNISINENGLFVSGFLNLEWILINAIQPYLSLLFSRKLRNATMEQLKFRRKTAAITSSAIPNWSKIGQIRNIAPIMHKEINDPVFVNEQDKI